MYFPKNAQLWLLALLMLLTHKNLKAQNTESALTGTFERVTDINEIAADDYCLFGAWAKYGKNPRTFNLAASSVLSSYKKKIKALPYSDGATKRIVCQDPTLVWHIQMQSDGNYLIRSASTSKVLSRKANKELGLLLESYKSKALSEWTITADGSGSFIANYAENGYRTLTCAYPNEQVVCFDNYAEGEPLYIYKRISTNAPDQGTISVPKDGASVALVSGNVAYDAVALKSVPTEGFLLTDSTYATDGAFSRFVCKTATDDAKAFSLKSEISDTYLSGDFTLTPEPALWQLRDGSLIGYSSVDDVRYVCYSAALDKWLLLTKEEQKEQAAQLATIGFLSPTPTSNLAEDGTMSLTGGWSAEALSQLDFSSATNLDLTGISLPVKARSFADTPPTANFPIFVANESSSAIPDDWHFVVVVNDNKYCLHKSTELADGEAYYSPCDITLGNAQLTYTRKPIEGTAWQTVCIPFAVTDLPQNAQFYIIKDQNANEMVLQSVSHLEAGKPYLFRSANEESGFSAEEVLQFICKEGNLIGSATESNGLQGVYSLFKVEQGASDAYMLNPSTSAFQRAATGSRLKPFRAFLRTANNAVKVRLILK